jgi:histidinol-phosphatase (PHP family)
MALPPDYHMHTPLCRHATGEPAEYAAQAEKNGLTEIGFSDHSPMPEDDFDDWRMRFGQLDEYVEKVRDTQRLFPQLQIKLGLEIDYMPGQEEWIQALTHRYHWDYLIGSVHYIADHWAVDNPSQVSKWKERDPQDIWSTYFERLTRAALSGCFDILAHVDLPKKFGVFPRPECAPFIQKFIDTARTAKVAVELNTAGLRKDCHEIYPGPEIVRLMCHHGIPIVFGSDAHAPEEVGFGFPQAMQSARQAGYTEFCRFSQRQRETSPLR